MATPLFLCGLICFLDKFRDRRRSFRNESVQTDELVVNTIDDINPPPPSYNSISTVVFIDQSTQTTEVSSVRTIKVRESNDQNCSLVKQLVATSAFQNQAVVEGPEPSTNHKQPAGGQLTTPANEIPSLSDYKKLTNEKQVCVPFANQHVAGQKPTNQEPIWTSSANEKVGLALPKAGVQTRRLDRRRRARASRNVLRTRVIRYSDKTKNKYQVKR
jgi:hypothetical protein